MNGQNNNLSYEKEVKDNGWTHHKHYLSAGGVVFAMQVTQVRTTDTAAPTVNKLQYLHHDHLGSVAVVTDETGSVAERLAYDPWGKRRFTNVENAGQADFTDSIVGLTLDRGFTMHEHLDEMGVIHMNGRIYDPLIGRFMSADPFIQAPENLQSHNRFAYVMNNPLSYTDPSGYFSLKKLFRAVVAIAVGYFTMGAASSWMISNATTGFLAGANGLSTALVTLGGQAGVLTGLGSAVAGAIGGFAAGLVGSGGDLKAGLLGALSGGMFGFVGGTYSAGSFGNYAGHAATGCITSVAGGGKCGSGAASALFGKYATNMTNGIQSDLGRGVASVVAGGVGSVIAGGKFENGATTAAFGYLFNQAMSAGARQAAMGAAAPGQGSNAEAVNALAVSVDKFFAGVADRLSYIFKSDSIILARNMAQDGDMVREQGQHAHHIVAANDPRAEPARAVLANAGMNINSAFNGVFLDPSVHARIHTNVYYNAVNDVLRGATNYVDVAARLTGIRLQINTGSFP